MGKEVKATEKVAENCFDIEKSIDDNVKLSQEIAKAAAEEINKKNKSRQIDEMQNCLMKTDFMNQYALLVLRKSRREEAADKDFLTALTTIKTDLTAGKHDTTTYNKALTEAREKKAKDYSAANNIFNEKYRKLRQNFEDYDTYEWQRLVTTNY